MKYMSVWSVAPDNHEAAMKRWKKRKAAGEKEAGIRTLGTWMEMGTGKGFSVFETDDPAALARLMDRWADLLDQKIVPVLDSDELYKALS